MLVKRLVLIDEEYENVQIQKDKDFEINKVIPDLIRVDGKDSTVYINPDMVMSLELADPSDKLKVVTSSLLEKEH